MPFLGPSSSAYTDTPNSRSVLKIILSNAGLPSVVDGHTHYDLSPEQLADAHDRFTSEFGVNIVGGCCGTTPAHIQAMRDMIDDWRDRSG